MSGMDVDSTVKINIPAIEDLTAAAERALALTTSALLSDVKNAMVFPFNDVPPKSTGKKTITPAGHLQNESTFPDVSHVDQGYAEIISDTLYGRRLYYHPEYNFYQGYNSNARGKWFEPWLEGGQKENFAAEKFAEIFKKESGL